MRLSDEDAALFYKLVWCLQFFVNQRLGIVPHVGTPEEYARLPQADKLRVRSALWEHSDLIDAFVAANPTPLSPDELAIVQSWKRFVAGDFFIERLLKKGAVFISGQGPAQVYLVLALYSTFQDILPPGGPPTYVKAVLLPFRGRIIYDGLLDTYGVVFGPGMRASFRDTYMRAKQQGQVIESLEPGTAAAPPAKRRLRPVPDLRPDVDNIVAAAERLKAPGQPVPAAALAVLKASARLAQASVQNPDDLSALWELGQSVQKAFRRFQGVLERAE